MSASSGTWVKTRQRRALSLCQYLYVCTRQASTFVLAQQVANSDSSRRDTVIPAATAQASLSLSLSLCLCLSLCLSLCLISLSLNSFSLSLSLSLSLCLSLSLSTLRHVGEDSAETRAEFVGWRA
jgi:hypothetical protein